jgi:2-oxoglutarate ferredoxin oxidoreductase subunit delta
VWLFGRQDNVRNAKGVGMAGRIVIDRERCKGCGLCVTVCPKNNIAIAAESNKNGYFPAQARDAGCTACAQCAVICPEGSIEVLLEEADKVRIVAAGAKAKKSTPRVVEEKR